MDTGFIKVDQRVRQNTRLSEFSLLLAALEIDAGEYSYVSLEPHGSYFSDIETIRTITSRISSREERVVTAFLPSFKNYFPDTFFVEQLEESDIHPGVMEDRFLEFWSAFDTITYRHWIAFYILKMQMLLFLDSEEVELLYWDRLGGDLPTVGREDRRYLLLLRFFAPFLRGRTLLYERVLPAFLKKPVQIEENIYSEEVIPTEMQCRLGVRNSQLGRTLIPGVKYRENFTTFRINVNELDETSIAAFAPGGSLRALLNNLVVLFAPAHLRPEVRFNFVSGLKLFAIGEQAECAYLGLSTFLRETA